MLKIITENLAYGKEKPIDATEIIVYDNFISHHNNCENKPHVEFPYSGNRGHPAPATDNEDSGKSGSEPHVENNPEPEHTYSIAITLLDLQKKLIALFCFLTEASKDGLSKKVRLKILTDVVGKYTHQYSRHLIEKFCRQESYELAVAPAE